MVDNGNDEEQPSVSEEAGTDGTWLSFGGWQAARQMLADQRAADAAASVVAAVRANEAAADWLHQHYRRESAAGVSSATSAAAGGAHPEPNPIRELLASRNAQVAQQEAETIAKLVQAVESQRAAGQRLIDETREWQRSRALLSEQQARQAAADRARAERERLEREHREKMAADAAAAAAAEAERIRQQQLQQQQQQQQQPLAATATAPAPRSPAPAPAPASTTSPATGPGIARSASSGGGGGRMTAYERDAAALVRELEASQAVALEKLQVTRREGGRVRHACNLTRCADGLLQRRMCLPSQLGCR
jgi:hypothetical protein